METLICRWKFYWVFSSAGVEVLKKTPITCTTRIVQVLKEARATSMSIFLPAGATQRSFSSGKVKIRWNFPIYSESVWILWPFPIFVLPFTFYLSKITRLYFFNINSYNVRGLQGQIITFQESRKKIYKKMDITFLIFSNRFGSNITCFNFIRTLCYYLIYCR
jgi:ATP-dependent Zn protease